jgi:hypothetical protein
MQRKNYKALKDNKKTPMTTEKVMKLSEIGFVFEATKLLRARKFTGNDDSSVEFDYN